MQQTKERRGRGGFRLESERLKKEHIKDKDRHGTNTDRLTNKDKKESEVK